jgi:hypothetical protein
MQCISMEDEEHHVPSFTPVELRRWGDKLADLAPMPTIMRLSAHRIAGLRRRRWTRFCEVWVKIVEAIFMAAQREVERRHKQWTRFCEVWAKIGLNLVTKVFTALPLPYQPRRPKLSPELLAKIEKREPSPGMLTRVQNYLDARANLRLLVGAEAFASAASSVEYIYAGLTNLERDLVEEMS